MSRKELTLMRRAYLLGLRRGFNRAQNVMRSKVDQWEIEIDELQADYEMLLGELRSARNEQAVREALAEREDTWLLH
jgi:hypothetical protein